MTLPVIENAAFGIAYICSDKVDTKTEINKYFVARKINSIFRIWKCFMCVCFPVWFVSTNDSHPNMKEKKTKDKPEIVETKRNEEEGQGHVVARTLNQLQATLCNFAELFVNIVVVVVFSLFSRLFFRIVYVVHWIHVKCRRMFYFGLSPSLFVPLLLYTYVDPSLFFHHNLFLLIAEENEKEIQCTNLIPSAPGKYYALVIVFVQRKTILEKNN